MPLYELETEVPARFTTRFEAVGSLVGLTLKRGQVNSEEEVAKSKANELDC